MFVQRLCYRCDVVVLAVLLLRPSTAHLLTTAGGTSAVSVAPPTTPSHRCPHTRWLLPVVHLPYYPLFKDRRPGDPFLKKFCYFSTIFHPFSHYPLLKAVQDFCPLAFSALFYLFSNFINK